MEHKTEMAAAAEESGESRRVAAQELHRIDATSSEDILDVTVTCDVAWAKRGFTSKFGIIICIMGVWLGTRL